MVWEMQQSPGRIEEAGLEVDDYASQFDETGNEGRILPVLYYHSLRLSSLNFWLKEPTSIKNETKCVEVYYNFPS